MLFEKEVSPIPTPLSVKVLLIIVPFKEVSIWIPEEYHEWATLLSKWLSRIRISDDEIRRMPFPLLFEKMLSVKLISDENSMNMPWRLPEKSFRVKSIFFARQNAVPMCPDEKLQL